MLILGYTVVSVYFSRMRMCIRWPYICALYENKSKFNDND